MQRTGGGGLAKRLLAGRAGVLIAMLAVACVVGVVLTIGSGGGVAIERPDGGVAEASESQDQDVDRGVDAAGEATVLVVHVDGAVAMPGVYKLSGDGLRVNDAIEAAGGLLGEADTSAMNLASALADGQKVHVPSQAEVASAGAGATGDAPGGAASGSALVNINLASADQLQALSGVGEATARAIVEDREAHGPFSSIEDLMRVSGIGQKKFEKLKGQICV